MSPIAPPVGTVLRSWTGWIAQHDRDAYREYLEATGLREYRATPGNLGALALYADEPDGRTRVTTLSFWTDFDVIRGFAGSDIDVAVFYPEDDGFLIDRETTVTHSVVVA